METLAEHVLRPLASISLMVHLYPCYSEVSISKTCCPHFVLEGAALHPAVRDPEFCSAWGEKKRASFVPAEHRARRRGFRSPIHNGLTMIPDEIKRLQLRNNGNRLLDPLKSGTGAPDRVLGATVYADCCADGVILQSD